MTKGGHAIILQIPRTLVYVQLRDAAHPAVIEADFVEEDKNRAVVVFKRAGQIVLSLDTKSVICWWNKTDVEDAPDIARQA